MSADYFHSERFVFHLCGFLSIHLPANTNKNHHESDTTAGRGEGVPGDVKPVGGGEELVGMRATSEKVDEVLELGWVLGMDVGGLADEVLGVLDAANEAVDPTVAEAGVDDDGADLKAGRFQEHQAAVG